MNPESEDECHSRKLNELQGKNISHYSILLSAIVQSELDSIKNIINLSSAGIGFLLVLEKFDEGIEFDGFSKILKTIIFIGFIVAILFGISFLLTASKHYEKLLKESNDDESRSQLIESRQLFGNRRKASMIAFLFGIIAFAVLGIFTIFV